MPKNNHTSGKIVFLFVTIHYVTQFCEAERKKSFLTNNNFILFRGEQASHSLQGRGKFVQDRGVNTCGTSSQR